MLTLTRDTGAHPCIVCNVMPSVYLLLSNLATTEMQGATEGVCQKCIDNACGPGKYEAYGNHDEHLAVALILEMWSMVQGEDEWMNSNGDYCGRFENYLLIQDDRGFVTFEHYDSIEKATKTYDSYFASGWGADEDDIYVSYERHPVAIWCEGKKIPLTPNANGRISENRIDAAINLHMAATGYFPNVWDSDGRGVTLRKMKVISWLT